MDLNNNFGQNLIVFFSGVIGAVLGFFILFKQRHWFFKFIGIVILIASVFGIVKTTVFQVDEGEALVVTQFRKIFTTVTTPGIHFKLPWMDTYSFPKRINTFSETMDGRSLDGLVIKFDITPFLRVDETHIEDIYRDIAKSYPDLENKIVLPAIRNIARTTLSEFNAIDIYNKRKELADRLESDAKEYLKNKYIILTELQLRNIELPEIIEQAIQTKLKKQQEAEAMEYEKIGAQKASEIKQIEAKGIAEAQKIINTTLTAKYLQLEAIKNYSKLADNPNKTFIIMPTDSKGVGVPMILDTK